MEKLVDRRQDNILYETIVSTPKFKLDKTDKHYYSSLENRPGKIDSGLMVAISNSQIVAPDGDQKSKQLSEPIICTSTGMQTNQFMICILEPRFLDCYDCSNLYFIKSTELHFIGRFAKNLPDGMTFEGKLVISFELKFNPRQENQLMVEILSSYTILGLMPIAKHSAILKIRNTMTKS